MTSSHDVEGAERAGLTSTAYPPLPIIRKLRFWLAFIGGFAGFLYILLIGGLTLRGNYSLQLLGFGLALTVALVWMMWRGLIWQDRLPHTGLELPILIGVCVIIVSFATSPDIRQGFSRTMWLIGYAIFFYFFHNILDTDLDRWGLLAAAITVSGLSLLQADLETIQWYISWFRAAGGFVLPPVQYRFTGVLSSSIALIALANLFLPVVVLIIFRFRSPIVRILCLYWLLFYLIAIPFSSSRGGWFGLVICMALAGLYWGWKSRLMQRIKRWPHRMIFFTGLGLLLATFLVSFAGYKFIVEFASHPSHGGNPFGTSGREVFWATAVKIWEAHPMFGAGPGRFAFEYLRFSDAVPPGFWPVHAHSIFFESLAEFGLFGIFSLLFLLGAIIRWSLHKLRNTNLKDQAWTAAILAGECGLLSQLVFDDLTFFMAVLVPAIFLLAWVGSKAEKSLPTYKKISLGWLGIPVFILIGVLGWETWGYYPYNNWLSFAQSGKWTQAAEQISISASRDPNFHFYATEAGLAWAWQSYYENDPTGLVKARGYFEQALGLEPYTSWIWADLGILDASSGDLDTAINHMEYAIKLSPDMAIYRYNLGIFYEKAGLSEKAISTFTDVLNLKPEWSNLALWDDTATRQQALDLWRSNQSKLSPSDKTYWHLAEVAIQNGEIEKASQLLTKSTLVNESKIDIARVKIQLEVARGDQLAIEQARKQLQVLVDQDQKMLDFGVATTYPVPLSNRVGTGIMAVPGLVPDITAIKSP